MTAAIAPPSPVQQRPNRDHCASAFLQQARLRCLPRLQCLRQKWHAHAIMKQEENRFIQSVTQKHGNSQDSNFPQLYLSRNYGNYCRPQSNPRGQPNQQHHLNFDLPCLHRSMT